MALPAAAPGSAPEPSPRRDRHVRKAVIPLAGLGTRLLPATKAVPKGMLPLIDKPVVQYIVEEAAAAGLTDVLLLTGDDQRAFRKHFGPAEHRDGLRLGFISQDEPRGLGDAVLRCEKDVGPEPFAVLFGDNVLAGSEDLLARLIAARQAYGGSILALTEVPRHEVSSRGVVAFEPTADAAVVRITDLVEKPAVADAPSNWIMIGRCVCDPAIFQVLRDISAGHAGELQLSDALRELSARSTDGGGVHGILFRGRRLDTGNRQDYVRAMIELACAREDVASEFLPWLRRHVAALG